MTRRPGHTRRRGRAASAAIVAVAASLVGCGPVAPGASCDDLHPGDDGEPHDAVVVLLDVADNRAAAADETADAIRPFLLDALETGHFVELVAYGGDGADVVTSDCLGGDDLLLVDKRNETARQNLMSAGSELLTDEVRSAVLRTPVADRGSPLRLLARVNERLATLRSAADVGDVTVVLHSDLLASSDTDDCLNADGVTATAEQATAMVERCVDEGQLAPLDGARLQLLGVGRRAETTSQTLLAAHLRRELCEQLAGGCLSEEADGDDAAPGDAPEPTGAGDPTTTTGPASTAETVVDAGRDDA
ncbi:MAG: hypothetical protein S0880_06895, partial [Actinomycetota bacterium]|nr:hypothetical protein [Actinomycetota bacterium]